MGGRTGAVIPMRRAAGARTNAASDIPFPLLPAQKRREIGAREHRVSTESSNLWKTVNWILPGLLFIPNKFDRRRVAPMRPFWIPVAIAQWRS